VAQNQKQIAKKNKNKKKTRLIEREEQQINCQVLQHHGA
jgi:hypothetical protein